MTDILFDIKTREIIMFKPGTSVEDVVLTDNPSVQNGGILLFSRVANVTMPIGGIGMEQVMNGSTYNAAFELNRWKAQAYKDGAKIASWKSSTVNNQLNFVTDQSYLP